MKLLIVEDESIIREGLLKITDWNKLGFETVLVADNGEAGIIMAKRMKPEIIISDIRMPKMNGLEMAEAIKKIHPFCRFVFVSAYSDKEYYKAAIRIKAVSFIEKPIDVAEVEEVVGQAIDEIKRIKIQASEGQLALKKELASQICRKINGENDFCVEHAFETAGWSDIISAYVNITAIGLKLQIDEMENGSVIWEGLENKLDFLEDALKFKYITTVWQHDMLFIYFFTQKSFAMTTLSFICDHIAGIINNTHKFYITVSKTVKGIKNIDEAFSSASYLMQRAFFQPYGQILLFEEETSNTTKSNQLKEYKKGVILALNEMNHASVLSAMDNLIKYIEKSLSFLSAGKVKEIYYELMSEVCHVAESFHINIGNYAESDKDNWVMAVDKLNLIELHNFVLIHIDKLYNGLQNRSNEKTQITAIRDYISRHYQNENLSVKSVSDYMDLSTSHICFVFKKETGLTINQYITNFRLERAKIYLRESKFSVSEISNKVGYRDNSYFGRIFRKTEGVTPLEYREMKLR